MLAWFAAYHLEIAFPFAGLAATTWHAHEMIYGYSMASAGKPGSTCCFSPG